jgi:hypothetical protein
MAPRKGGTCIRGSAEDRLNHYHRKDPETGCWVWTGSIFQGRGYGQASKNGRVTQAHRLSYETFVGEIPPGMCVCHKCDNRPCINPEHLFLGTAKDNQHDAIAKGRNTRGSQHWAAKLTESNVVEIFALIDAGISDPDIAKRYGVIAANIHHIRHRNSWKHVPRFNADRKNPL